VQRENSNGCETQTQSPSSEAWTDESPADQDCRGASIHKIPADGSDLDETRGDESRSYDTPHDKTRCNKSWNDEAPADGIRSDQTWRDETRARQAQIGRARQHAAIVDEETGRTHSVAPTNRRSA
jgi:hypothetical protein